MLSVVSLGADCSTRTSMAVGGRVVALSGRRTPCGGGRDRASEIVQSDPRADCIRNGVRAWPRGCPSPRITGLQPTCVASVRNPGLNCNPFIFSSLGIRLQRPCTFPCTIRARTVPAHDSPPRTDPPGRLRQRLAPPPPEAVWSMTVAAASTGSARRASRSPSPRPLQRSSLPSPSHG